MLNSESALPAYDEVPSYEAAVAGAGCTYRLLIESADVGCVLDSGSANLRVKIVVGNTATHYTKFLEASNVPIRWNEDFEWYADPTSNLSLTIESGGRTFGRVHISTDELLKQCTNGAFAVLQFMSPELEIGSITANLCKLHEIPSPALVPNPHELGIAALERYDQTRAVIDLEEAILNLQRAVDLADDASSTKPTLLCYLAEVRKERYELFGDANDLVSTISSMQSAVNLTVDSDPSKPDFLTNLGITQLTAFEILGSIADLDESIASQRHAIRIMVPTDPRIPSILSNLSRCLVVRYERLEHACDIDESMIILKKAIQLTDISDPAMLGYLLNLVKSRQSRFQTLGNVADLDTSITDMLHAVRATDNRHAGYLNDLANAHIFRFDAVGDTIDLEAALTYLQRAVEIVGDNDWGKPEYLSALGGVYGRRYERFSRPADLENSIANVQKAVLLTPDYSPTMGSLVSNLASSLLLRYDYSGSSGDLTEALSNHQWAVDVTRDGHPNKPGYVSSLGMTQVQCYKQFNEPPYLEKAAANLLLAVQMVGERSPRRLVYLASYGSALRLRFQLHRGLADLEEAIIALKEAVHLTDDRNPEKPSYLNILGNCQSDRYIQLGELADLEESITSSRRAVVLTADTHMNKSLYLTNLGTAQGRLFRRLWELKDIREAISNLKEAIRLNNRGNEKGGLHSNLSISELSLFARLKDPVDLDSSIENTEKAILLASDNDVQFMAGYHYNCANGLLIRFENYHRSPDIQAAVLHYEKAAQLTSDVHPDKPSYLSWLGHAQQQLFENCSNLVDLENAISNHQRAIELSDDVHQERVQFLANCANSHICRFRHFHNQGDLESGIATYKLAVQLKTAYPEQALYAARLWAKVAHEFNHLEVALEGYRVALGLFPKVAWLGVNADSHHQLLVRERSEDLVCMAAKCAIELGQFEEAVELLELGRSIFWQKASSLRSDLTLLREEEPELAVELEQAGRALDAENFSATMPIFKGETVEQMSAEHIRQERRRLLGVWDALVERVRQIPKFEYFLRPIPFQQLRRAATGGQIIVINVTRLGGDAMIFDDIHPVIHVPLPDIDIEELKELCDNILLQRPTNTTEQRQQRYVRTYLKPALRTVWRDIVVPIFNQIQVPIKTQKILPTRRIWWYPTGPLTFVPFHAAGPGTKIDVSSLIVSSYVTTLDSLLRAQQKARIGQMKLLTISQPNTPGQRPLPLSLKEAQKVVQAAVSAGWPEKDIQSLNGSEASVDRVVSALESASWVHFACHGMQDAAVGMNSAFALDNGNLELREIASKRMVAAQFGFLSVCNAASGLRDLPAESMHLAGGLQFAGFPSVIATLWAIADLDAPRVAAYAYEYLFRNGSKNCDPSEAATALNHAVLRLREDPTVTVDRWAPFIHFGM